MTTTGRPENVIAALSAVMAEMPGIAKDQDSSQGYKFRGIEAVAREAQPLLAKYGVVFVPRVVERSVKEFPINSRPWTEDCLHVEYDVYGPGGIEDKITVGPIVGLGRDNSDKGASKATTMAYKIALLQVLCIADVKDDPDHGHHEADAPAAPVDPARVRRSELATRVRALPESVRESFKAWASGQGLPDIPKDFTDAQCGLAEEWADNAEDEQAQDAVTPTDSENQAVNDDDAPVVAENRPEGAQTEGPDRYSSACALVTSFDIVQILQDLKAYGVTPARSQKDQRAQLVEALMADADWNPMGVSA